LLAWGNPETRAAQGTEPPDASESLAQAALTLRDLFRAFYGLLPKIVLSLLVLAVAILAARLVRRVLRRTLSQWERADALSALVSIALYLAAIAISLSVLAGDPGALLASIGLIGLALSWALQTPIESFTGWLVNSLRVYYRIGDRIAVGDVFGDVYKIDILTTTVWEAGGPGKAVAGAQPTGAMITFPNWEVLRSNIVNYSREFPFVWDEVTIGISNESDLAYAIGVFERVARGVLGSGMPGAAEQYHTLLAKARVAFDVDEEPRVFVSSADAWTNCTVRYLVDARYRRRRASDLVLSLSKAAADPAHSGRIVLAYPRTEVRLRDQWAGE
jgi:small-conductance mechanosensitive channel